MTTKTRRSMCWESLEYRTPLREVHEIEETNTTIFKVKREKGMQTIENYDLYARMASHVRKLANPELRTGLHKEYREEMVLLQNSRPLSARLSQDQRIT